MVASADFDPRAAQYALNLQSSADGVVVPGGAWLLTADFARSGHDLVIHGADGVSAIVPNYFAGETSPPLITDTGARLDGALVETLAGPRAPLQYADLQLAQASDASGAIGRVTAIEGVVQVSRADGSQAQLAEGDAVFPRDVIQAAADGKISIEFVDGTSFALSDGARMTLDDLVFNPGGGGNVFSASVLQGTFVFLTGQIAPSGDMNVTTPVGTIGVRGTKVVCRLAVEGQESIITLLVDPDGHVGRVEVTNGAGTRILEQANQATRVVSFFVEPSEPFILSQPELLDLFDDAIRMLDRSNGTNPDNEDQGGSTDDPEAGDTAENIEQQLDEAAEALGEFETAAGELTELPQTFVPLPDFSIPDAASETSFTTVTAGGEVQFASASYGDDSSGGDWQPADTRDTEESAAPPPPPPSPYTVISGGAGDDKLGGTTNPGQLQVFGNAGNDTLSGGTQSDKLDGGDGDDTLDAGPGDDIVQGGGGNDLIIGGSGEGDDQLDGGADIDTVKYQSASQDIDVNLTTGKASGDPLIGSDTLANIENVIGGSGNDTITGNGAANLLDGGAGNDKISGLAGNDTLIGGAGDDELAGGAGNDLLQGGADDDVAVFSGNLSDYTVSLVGGQLVLTDQRPGGDGVDTLDGVESVKFADQAVNAIDLLGPANEAPTAILLSNDTVAENADGAVIGTVTVLDPDGGDTHTFTLSDNRFQIVGGELILGPGESLDFEAEPTVSLEITATDAGGLSYSQTFIIHATDVNEPPSTLVDANAAANQVAENAVNGTPIGITAAAVDPDAGDAITYSLVDDAGGRFAIDANTGVVTVADGTLLDSEAASSHQITVQAASSGGLVSTQDFTINVVNANDPPSEPVDVNEAGDQVAENATTGTLVGITASSTDPDLGDVVTYSLVDDAGGRFAIDADTGVVTVADGGLLNFEAATSHQITVQASSSGGLTSTQNFTIAITNVNEAPGTPVDINAVANAVAEGAANGTPVGITVSAADPDAGDTVAYSLTDNAGGRFAIDANTGIVTVADGSLLEVSNAASHEITVLASSSGGLTSSQSFTIAVTNVNDPPSVPVDDNGAANQVAENAANGTLVGLTALAVDPDPSDPVVYSLTDDAGGRFAIDANTGVVTVANGTLLNFEDATAHQITVQASSSGGLSTSQTFTIDVTNVNEPPSPILDDDDAGNNVAENAAAGTAVGVTALAGDPDAADPITYTLTNDAGGRFAIDATTGVVTVADGAQIDFESATSHQITVKASSSGGLSSVENFVINVGDVNEAPVITSGGGGENAAVAVSENTTAVTVVAAADLDSGDSVTYSIAGGVDGGLFEIDANTGALSFTAAPDFENPGSDGGGQTYEVLVRATDGGGKFDEQLVAVTVEDANEPPAAPIDTDDSPDLVAENAVAGTAVGIVAQSFDADSGDTVTYSLTDDAGGRFAIDANTGEVTVANGSLLDFESATSNQITVQATSSGGLNASQTFTVNLSNVNEAPSTPVDANGAVNLVAENAANGTLVGITASSIDPDAGDTVTYSLTDDAGGRFAIDANTGVVSVANGTLLDFESATSHQITVQASSSGGLPTSQSFTVNVGVSNEPPSEPVDVNEAGDQAAENAAAGTLVGVTASSTDPDLGDVVTYTLTDDAGGRFAIDADTGVVTVADGSLLDFEGATSHQITVQAASSGGLTSTQNFTIAITNVNEAPDTPFDINAVANSVAEGAANGTPVGITVSATDPDAGDPVTYSLLDDAGGRFAIDANTGIVTVADGSLLNVSNAASHEITVLASSSGGLNSSQSFTIGVTNVNEPPSAPVDDDGAANQVAENAANGTAVGVTASAIDPDLGDTITYSLTDDAGGRFAIDADTGVVTVANGGLLNFEGATSHQITVQAASNGGLTSTQDFTIAVTDVNEAPGTPIDTNAAANAVAENAANGTPVGITVSATDPDAGDTVTYSLTDDAGGRFAIDANTGIVTVADGGLLNYEAATSHQITVQATSSGGLNASQSFTIAVTNVNEAPSAPVDGNGAANQVAENAANGTLVGITAAAIDPDAGDTVTFSLLDDAGGRFAIDATTGVVTVANGTLLNFENAASHQITVQAASSGGLTSTQNFTISVTDVNEPPSAISDGNAAANTVAENAAAGTVVGVTALAVDPDAGDSVTFTLISDSGGRFVIDAGTGVVTVADGAPLDFETATFHQITVKATSSGGLSSVENFVINVGDVNEAPSTPVDVNGALNLVTENAPDGTLVGITASSTDPDAGDGITYSLTDDAGGRFAIDPVTGVVSVADGAPLAEGSYDIVVQASSSGGLSASQTFTVSVADGNDGPVLTAGTLSVAQGAPDLVHETELLTTDSDTTPGQIVYTLTVLPVLGVLLLNNEELGLGETFTQQDIADGNLQYLTPNAGADSFTVDITDGANPLLGQVIQVNVVDSGAHTDGDVGVPNVSDPLIVGDTAFGRLNIIGGGEVAAGSGVILGNNASGDGIVWVDGVESKLSAGGFGVEVAKAGTGLALVTGGGLIEASRVTVGVEAGSLGNLSLVGGTLRTLGTDNGLFVGAAGVGILQVESGGVVTGLQMVLGDKSNGFGTATISGTGSQVVISNDDGLFSAPNQGDAGQVVVGEAGLGDLQVLDGGHLEIRSGESANTGTTNPLLAIGHQEGSSGFVTIGGAGTTLELSMSAAADPGDAHDLLRGPGIAIGLMGDGIMVVEDNAAVSLDGDEAFVAVGVGNYLDDGDTTPYPTASLTIATGGKVELTDSAGGEGGLLIGDFQSGTGVVNVIGVGSLLSIDSQGGAAVGNAGTGTLNVLAGGKVEIASDGFNNLVLGATATGEGQATVSGIGSTLTATGLDNAILVGAVGKGGLDVTGGGSVTTLYLAVGQYGEGTATIDGAGSKVVVSNDGGNWSGDDAIYGGWVNVAQHAGSTGSLTIQDGGALEIRDGVAPNDNKIAPGMSIGSAKYSSGVVEVTGAGSSITVSMSGIADENDEHPYLAGPSIIVGGRGEGTLLVADEAKIQITGNEAYLDVGLGNSGHPEDPTEYYSGTLIISGGATVEVIDLTGGNGGLLVGDWQGGNGAVTVTGTGSLLAVTSEGGADIGNDGTGELIVAAGGAVTVHSDSFNNLNIGNDYTASGKVLVTGGGSTITTSGIDNTIQVGRYGEGQLDVENGGVVSTLQFEVGRAGTGIVNIDGASSKVIASNDGGLFSDPYAGEAGFVRVGRNYGSHGEIHITNGGVLEIRPGETVNTDTNGAQLEIARFAGSTGEVTVSGSGSAIILDGKYSFLEVGREGNGSLSITDGAQATAEFVEFGRFEGSEGAGLISGAGSKINAGGLDSGISVGRYGTGTLTVAAGGYATTDFVNIGRESTGDGTITVTGAGSALVTDGAYSGMNVGRYGTGVLNVTAGGLLQSKDVNIGHFYGGNGTATVSGSGSKLVVEGEDAFLGIGQEGTGLLKVEAGGQVETLWINVGGSGSGELSIDGGGSKVIVSNDSGLFSGPEAGFAGGINVGRDDSSDGKLSVTNGGTLEVRPGETINTDTKYAEIMVARNSGSNGEVIVDGAGSSITISGPESAFIIGGEGYGSLSVTDGGVINAGFFQFGAEVGAQGTGLVSGTGSKISVTGDESFNVGRYGQGVLTISSGGQVSATYIHLGRANTGTGQVVVTGADSELIGTGSAAGTLSVGREGWGSLTVADGGLAQAGWVNIGSYAGAIGIAAVTGAGSKLAATLAELNVGRYGDGTLAISAGGAVEGTFVHIGERTGSEGEVTITGAGSTMVTSGTDNLIQVGLEGEGGLNVQAGGVVSTLHLEVGRVGIGIVNIDGPGSKVIASNDGGLFSDPYAWEAGFVRVGRDDGAHGEIHITNGGVLEIRPGETINTGTTGAELQIARNYGSTGVVTVSGPGSAIIVEGDDATITVGEGGSGSLTITDGASVEGLRLVLGHFASGDGELLISDGGSLDLAGVGSDLRVGRYGSGVLNILSGGTSRSNYVEIGHFTGSDGKALVNGAGSQLVTEGTYNAIQVGREGTGALTVQNGGTVKTLALIVGREGDGTVTIEGAGSAIIVSNDEGLNGGIYAQEAGFVRVARESGSEGKLEITSGGLLEIRPGLTENTDTVYAGMSVGRGSGSSGHVLVSGSGSRIRIYQEAVSPLGLGAFAGAFLNLHADSDLKVTNNAQVTIEGPGSHLGVGGQYAGNSSLEVLSGASILLDGKIGEAGIFVGGGVASGSVLVSGPGSTITVTGDTQTIFHVGYGADASVVVTSAGMLDVGDSGDAITAGVVDYDEIDVQVFSHGTLDGGGGTIVGDLFVDFGSKLRSGDGTVAPMSIQGDFHSYQATIEIDAQGHQWSDIYDVSGEAVLLDSIFEFSFLSGYLPQEDDNFTFLHAGEGINIDLNNIQYILHNITAGGVFAFAVTQDGNDLTFNSYADTFASDGLLYRGSDNADVFSATAGADELYGRDGNDTLSGGAGNDWIVGGYGDDNLDGGADADQFFYDAPIYQAYVGTNQLVSASGETGDLISNFDATVTGGDQFVFDSAQFGVLSGISNLNFSVIATEYDGTNGTSADYLDGKASFLLDSQNHLIYDDNGAADGYTVIATVDLASGSPPITADNLQAA